MTTETFPDGSTIETDEATGNRTVCGKLAHDEYLRRLRAEEPLTDEEILNRRRDNYERTMAFWNWAGVPPIRPIEKP